MTWLQDSARYAYMAYHGDLPHENPKGWQARSEEYSALPIEEQKRWEAAARAVANNDRDLYD